MSGRGNPSLKEMIARDIGSRAVFFNPKDFREWHDIDGRRMACIVEKTSSAPFSDGVTGRTANRGPNDVGRTISRTYSRETTIIVRASDYGPKPAVGYRMVLDGIFEIKLFSIQDDHGVYVLTGKENDL